MEITFVAVHPDEHIRHDDQVLNKPMLLCPITKRCIVVVEVLVGLLEPYASTSLVFEDDLLTQEDWYHGGQLKIDLVISTYGHVRSSSPGSRKRVSFLKVTRSMVSFSLSAPDGFLSMF